MPPRARTSKKRARSPAAPKATEKPEKAQTRSSKRTKKDAQDASAVAADGTDAQAEVVETPPVAVKTTTPAKTKETDTDKSNAPPAPASPSFGGNFDLYAMSLPFLNSVFTPARDYAALLATIRTYQAKPDNSAQIFLPADLGPSSGADGRFRSRAIEDPLEGMPFDVALSAPALADSVALGAREDAGSGSGSSDAFYSSSTPDSDARGVTASVGLEDGHCGIASTRGVFKMRRAWASDDGQEEVFEGFFKIGIVYSGLYRRKCWEDGLDVSFAFWAVRARVGADGEEIGLGPGSE